MIDVNWETKLRNSIDSGSQGLIRFVDISKFILVGSPIYIYIYDDRAFLVYAYQRGNHGYVFAITRYYCPKQLQQYISDNCELLVSIDEFISLWDRHVKKLGIL